MTQEHIDADDARLRRAMEGDFLAFEELVRDTEGRVYQHLLRLTDNQQDARELLQETYLSAWRHLAKFRGGSSFYTWVYRIATNHALMLFRKRKGVTETSLDELSIPSHEELKKRHITDWDLDPAEAAHRKEVREILENAISKLSPPYRAVVALRDVEGLSTQEAAEILGISEGAVKTRLHRARIFLREALDPFFGASAAGERSASS